MKKLIITSIFLLAVSVSFTQNKPKKTSAEKIPTQKEMQDMMKEAQKEIDNMSPEDKKMMDSLGIKMPDMNSVGKNVSGVSDAQLQNAFEDESKIVPKRDEIRIAAIPKGVTDARMKTYVASIHKKVTSLLETNEIKNADLIYEYIENEKISKENQGNIAMGFWMAGNQKLALFLLGKISSETPTANNLNNYASMLTMMGGEHIAIPILENLSKKIPKNIILLNNLGQAWFGLGEITKAEKYLDSAIAIYPSHPQANFTKAEIAESKGEKSKAIEALKKSIKHAYSEEKEAMLKKLGYKLKIEDLRLPFKPDADLQLDRFKRPNYPKSVSESNVLKLQWENFTDECVKEIEKLNNDLITQTEKYSLKIQKKSFGNLQTNNNGYSILSVEQPPIFAIKAGLQMDERKSFYEFKWKEMSKKLKILTNDLDNMRKQKKRCASESCTCHKDAESDFLKNYNERKQAYDDEVLKIFKQFYEEMVSLSQYTSWDEEQFELIKLNFMIDFVGRLIEYKPEFSTYDYLDCVEEENVKPFKLAEWDFSSNCKYNVEINFALIKQQINCAHTTTTIDAKFLKNLPVVGMGEKYVMVEVGNKFERSTLILTPKIDLSTDLTPFPISAGAKVESTITINTDADGKSDWTSVTKAGVELGVGKSLGPVKLKATIGESVEIEYGSKGLKDVNLIAEAEINAGIQAPKADVKNPENADFNENIETTNKVLKASGTSVKIGIQDRVSLVSGHVSVNTTGIFGNINISDY